MTCCDLVFLRTLDPTERVLQEKRDDERLPLDKRRQKEEIEIIENNIKQ